jgi:CO/xanthine dehydrogenase Mo-binding subunit
MSAAIHSSYLEGQIQGGVA